MKLFVLLMTVFVSVTEAAKRIQPDMDLSLRLPDGIVAGEEVTGSRGNVFYSFRGIPYAEPPLGKLRFKPPVPKKPWKGVLKTIQDGPPCPQMNFFSVTYEGREDCLYLNVYTPIHPKLNNSEKLDVVYNIHGGGFEAFNGGSKLFDPKRFPLNHLILVSVTYRVGALGFLSTRDAVSPGNYGLLDQREGLRWVQRNIEFFGGNPERVTLFGQSAGAASVIYQMLSSLSTGLFHEAIATSGSPLCAWAYQADPIYWAKKLAKNIGCAKRSSRKMLACLRTKSAQKITEKATTLVSGLIFLAFTPTTDNYFIKDTPINLIKKKKYNRNIPLLIGTTKDEGNSWYLGRKNSPQDFTKEEIFQVLRTTVSVRPNTENLVYEIIKKYHLDELKNYNEDYVQKRLGKIFTDGIYHNCIFKTVKELSKSGTRVHFFMYDYEAPYSQSQLFNKSATYGVCHGDDLYPLFQGPLFQLHSSDEISKKMRENYRELIKNFIRQGDPMPLSDDQVNCNWPPIELFKFFRYHFDTHCSVELSDPHYDDLYKFWTKDINPPVEIY